MHAETLAYLLHNLPVGKKNSPAGAHADPRPAPRAAAGNDSRRHRDAWSVARTAGAFGWDNEFDVQQIHVPSFSIDVFPVTNGEYLKFVHARRLRGLNYWQPEDWEWKRSSDIEHPHFWVHRSSSLPQPIPTRSGNTERCSGRFLCRCPGLFT